MCALAQEITKERFSLLFFVMLINVSVVFSQDYGGMLCGDKNENPLWILRFEVLDEDTHYPVVRAKIKITDNSTGLSMSWRGNEEGVAVLVVEDIRCIPASGTLEITAKDYRYYTEEIAQWDFTEREDDYRILLEGHQHNWTDYNQFPSTKELIDKISEGRYLVGVELIKSGMGFNWINYAPACFEKKIKFQKVE